MNEIHDNQFFIDRLDVAAWLDRYGIEKYTIDDNLCVSVEGRVEIDTSDIEFLPVKFSQVRGDFSLSTDRTIAYGKITSLIGCPEIVGGRFYCMSNKIKSLIGGPRIVGESYDCADNLLINLDGAPEEVGQAFLLENNQIESTALAREIRVRGDLNISHNRVISFDGFKANIGGDLKAMNNSIESVQALGQCQVGGHIFLQKNPGLLDKLKNKGYKTNTGEFNGDTFLGTELISALKIEAEQKMLNEAIQKAALENIGKFKL